MESQAKEYKPSWRDEFLKELSGFANGNGGELIIGMDDNGKPLGVQNPKKLLEDLPNKIRNKLGVIPLVELHQIEGKNIVRIVIKPSSVPISYGGKFYLRSGSTTQELKGKELQEFLLKKSGKTWDALSSDVDVSEADLNTVEEFRQLAKHRISAISKMDSLEKIFSNLGLITYDGKLTNAGVLLFGKEPQKYILSAETRVGRFRTSTDITDTVVIKGNLFKQVEAIVESIKKHLKVKFEIKGIHRKDIWDYPLEAIREAVINSLIHKDYSAPADVQVKIYDDKLWIWNPGSLPPQLTVDDLKKEHTSYPRNPLVANVFYLAGLIEKWGSGTNRIMEMCKEMGLPEPEYKEEQGGFSVWFYKDLYTEENLIKLGLNERQIKAVLYVKQNGKITNGEYQKINNCSRNTATNDLKDLIQKGILKESGKKGAGAYYVTAQ